MEGTRDLYDQSATDDVIVSIVATGIVADMNKGGGSSSSVSTSQEGFDFGIKSVNKEVKDTTQQGKFSINTKIPPEISMISPLSTPQRPPKIPSELTRRRNSLARSALSRTKSRFVEPSYHPGDEDFIDESTRVLVGSKTPLRTPRVSPRVSVGTPVILKSPFSVQGNDDEEDEDVYKSIDLQLDQQSRKKLKVLVILEWMIFLSLMGLLIASLTIQRLKDTSVWSLGLWKWCVFVIVIFCGRLVTGWFITILVYLVERKLLLKRKVLYFVYGLKKSVRVFLWLSFVLVAWILLFIHGNSKSRKTKQALHYITMAIAGCLVGAGIWLVKTILIKILALSFHVKRFFDRIQESLFDQYVLQTLSGPPFMEMAESLNRSRNSGRLSLEKMTKGERLKEEVINVEKLNKINQEKVSAWTMKGLINVIRRTKLSTISNTLEYGEDDEMGEQNNEITSEWEAKVAAVTIFNNVAKPDCKCIDEEDLLRFMKMNEVNQVFPLFEGAVETGKIKKSALKKWVVNSYLERKSLAHSLNDTKTAVEELNRLLLVVFMFGNSVKTVFEAIIFVFIMHPFDVGDRCVIDGVQMIVEEMNILTTIFLRYDNEKIIYPNSTLSTKPISNFYRSPEMGDSVEFAVDFSTTVDVIAALKTRIKSYLESKPEHWRPGHSVQLKEIVDMNKIKMTLYATHTINFQNIGEKGSRRSDLILELKKIFQELGIIYHLLPQEVHVKHVESASFSQ
ncbi:mechanosensitive ion channel protein 10 isoform X2 [Beta vulgaris subsp. vulgaris]|uniref:mechanosensitive ion channel protein 10 isoform X2 n=1 Tax=Beta vulgaris subsp. vulgaris TaxID=3555 RepID=UPI002037623E|nr:mechanosensitive ion channel protein 10 isoform X2 [Beta vulgaris subsp. vulgaris]